MKRESLTAALVLVVLAAAPVAFAQKAKPKKKGAKPAASASASATDTAPPADTTPPAAPTTSTAPEEAPSASASAELPNTPPQAASDSSNTVEDPLKTYYFIGARYRGTVIPQFLVNAFVNGGATFYSNMGAIELDIRKDGHTTMPWIGIANYGFGNTLFENNGSNGTGTEFAGNWTVVSSSLNALYLGLDEKWSVKLDDQQHWFFEYGFGVGLGVVFGTLNNTWVHTQSGTQISPGNYVPCTQADVMMGGPVGCQPADHQNATTNKVGASPGQYYSEKAGLLGPKPILFPYISFPDIGVRWKPVKQFEARLGIGFSLTGFYFGISGDYGLEQPESAGETPQGEKTKASSLARPRGML